MIKDIREWYIRKCSSLGRTKWNNNQHIAYLLRKLNEEIGELGEQLLLDNKKEIADEIGDIVIYLHLLADRLDLNILECAKNKIERK